MTIGYNSLYMSAERFKLHFLAVVGTPLHVGVFLSGCPVGSDLVIVEF